MSTRRASPEDISRTGRSARCDIFESARAASASSRCRRSTSWCGKMRVLLKKPDSTTSRPQASPEHRDIKSFDTIPSNERSSKISPALLPQDGHRRALLRQGIAFPRDGLDQGRLAAAVRTEDGHMFVAADHQAEIFQHNLSLRASRRYSASPVEQALAGSSCS